MSEVKVPVTRRIFLSCHRKKIPVKQKQLVYTQHNLQGEWNFVKKRGEVMFRSKVMSRLLTKKCKLGFIDD